MNLIDNSFFDNKLENDKVVCSKTTRCDLML